MQKKITVMLLLLISLSLIIAGCGQKGHTTATVKTPLEAAKMAGDPLQNLAFKEIQLLPQIDVIKAEIDKDYQAWQQGKLKKEEFVKNMQENMVIVKNVRKDFEMHKDANPLPESEKNQSIYIDGLVYGDKLIKEINDFAFMTTNGIVDVETKKIKPLTDEQIKVVYQNNVERDYADYHAKLVKALDQFKNTK